LAAHSASRIFSVTKIWRQIQLSAVAWGPSFSTKGYMIAIAKCMN